MKYYENVMKPLFHNFKSLYNFNFELESTQYWKEYTTVSQNIAAMISKVKSDYPTIKMVAIHGNNLIMVPYYVKKLHTDTNIGFFFHSPFPSSDIFRMFKFRLDILQSLLSSDLVGFHLYEYARNFFKSCHRLLGLNYEFRRGGYLGINFHGKNVMIRVSHISIDVDLF